MMFRDASGFSTTAVRSPFRGGFVHRGSGAEACRVPRREWNSFRSTRPHEEGRCRSVPPREWKGRCRDEGRGVPPREWKGRTLKPRPPSPAHEDPVPYLMMTAMIDCVSQWSINQSMHEAHNNNNIGGRTSGSPRSASASAPPPRIRGSPRRRRRRAAATARRFGLGRGVPPRMERGGGRSRRRGQPSPAPRMEGWVRSRVPLSPAPRMETETEG